MWIGVLLALLSYSVYSISDSVVKSFGGGTLSAFELNFFLNLFALVALPFARGRDDKWRDLFKFRHPWLMNARALMQTMAGLCFTVALTQIPLAETYSLVFLTPLFLSLLSVVVLKERVVATRWLLVTASFVGVLVVVRPGFHQLGVGHAAAIGCAVAAAGSNVILRIISASERHASIMVVTAIFQVAIAGVLMLGNFVVPTPYQLGGLAIAGCLSGAGQLLIIRGMHRAPASQIGPTIYVQIIWGVVLGALFYGERQDAIGSVGLVLIVIAGVATVFSDGAQARIVGRWAEFRARRGEAAANDAPGPDL